MAYFNLPVKTFPLEKMASKFRIFKETYNWYVAHHLDKFKLPLQGLDHSFFDNSLARVYRDDDYLKYKTYNPTLVINIQGAEVWLKINNGLVIGDVTLPNDFEKMIGSLKELARKLGLRQVMFQVSEGMPLYHLLQNYAKPQYGFPVIIKDLGSGLLADKLKFTFADIDIF